MFKLVLTALVAFGFSAFATEPATGNTKPADASATAPAHDMNTMEKTEKTEKTTTTKAKTKKAKTEKTH